MEANELEVPKEYTKKEVAKEPTIMVKQEVSIADELTKLKKLMDDGI